MNEKRSRTGTIREQLYDGKYDLRLGIAQLEELEEKLGLGSHAILNALAGQDFRVRQITEIIRLGLIGSGEMSPRNAYDYVMSYIIEPKDRAGRTFIMDYHAAARDALFASLYGPEGDEPPVGKAEAEVESSPTPSDELSGGVSTEPLEPSA